MFISLAKFPWFLDPQDLQGIYYSFLSQLDGSKKNFGCREYQVILTAVTQLYTDARKRRVNSSLRFVKRHESAGFARLSVLTGGGFDVYLLILLTEQLGR